MNPTEHATASLAARVRRIERKLDELERANRPLRWEQSPYRPASTQAEAYPIEADAKVRGDAAAVAEQAGRRPSDAAAAGLPASESRRGSEIPAS